MSIILRFAHPAFRHPTHASLRPFFSSVQVLSSFSLSLHQYPSPLIDNSVKSSVPRHQSNRVVSVSLSPQMSRTFQPLHRILLMCLSRNRLRKVSVRPSCLNVVVDADYTNRRQRSSQYRPDLLEGRRISENNNVPRHFL